MYATLTTRFFFTSFWVVLSFSEPEKLTCRLNIPYIGNGLLSVQTETLVSVWVGLYIHQRLHDE